MKKGMILVLVAQLLFWSLPGCEETTKSDELDPEKTVVLNGQVTDINTAAPLANTVVRIINFTPELTAITDNVGKFTFEFEVEETQELEIVAFRENFIADTISVLAVPGRTIDDLRLALVASGTASVPSGEAASIILGSVSPSPIGVRESGAPEVSEITFVVLDSMGVRVDIDHKVTVNFQIGSSPGGGAFIHPASGETDNSGRVYTNLFSGDSAGVVQLIAVVDQNGKTIRSKPVTVAIHGGLPDLGHFSIASEKLNFPGYNIFGLFNGITAYVGDKYGNPVKPQTPVYFTTTGGIIGGSALTNDMGQGSVNLMSAEPRPNHPVYGPGFATIIARTSDENQNTIEANTIVLFSGIPQVSLSSFSIDVPDKGSQSFSFTVSDQNGNPLAGGTTIKVAVEAGEVKAVGNTEISLPDTQSRYWTTFGFSLVDAKPDTLMPNVVSVKISSLGPNGGIETSISGIAR